MDAATARNIQSLSDWDELRRFEVNTQRLGRMTPEVADAVRARSTELGRVLVAEKTGLALSALTPAEAKIVEAVSKYVAVLREKGRYPQRTFDQIRNRGLIGAAEAAVCRNKPTQGFETLVDANLEELSYEQIVVDHPEEFSQRAQWFAARALGLAGLSDSPPADPTGDTQSRTANLLAWLRSAAQSGDGVLPVFTNADAAHAMGLDDMKRFGQVHGNIQSRIDLACYRCGLPPLGLAAEKPFRNAWAQQQRSWKFPLEAMQQAAQARLWSPQDFDAVLRTTERLPSMAHQSWKQVFADEEESVKAWAFSFAGSEPMAADEAARPRNPGWSRDELLLALDLYLRHRGAPLGKDAKEVQDLSEFLNGMMRMLGGSGAATYRNPNGVYMKLMNFRRLDPKYTADGRVGLTRGNRDEELVWREFADNPSRLSEVVAAIRSALAADARTHQLTNDDEPDIVEAEEGRVLTRLHRYRERDRRLVEAAKSAALKRHGRLICQACELDLGRVYGPTASGVIDVHHTKPVHTLAEGEKTRLEDLVLLCPNCHRVIHSRRRWLSVAEVRLAIADAKAGT